MRTRLALATIALWAIVGFGGQPAHAQESTVVDIHQYKFQPDHLDLEVGDPVTWTNHDSARHDVSAVSGPEPFQSPLLGKGESFTWAPTVAGAFVYICTTHDDMTATITVTAPALPPPTSAAPLSVTTTTVAALAVPSVIPTRTVAAQASLRPFLVPIAVALAAVTFTVVLMTFDRRRSV